MLNNRLLQFLGMMMIIPFYSLQAQQLELMTDDCYPRDTLRQVGFTEYCNKLYFSAWDTDPNYIEIRELWVSDGTKGGTKKLLDLNPNGGSNPLNLTVFKNLLFFTAWNKVDGRGLYKSDGTVEGTEVVTNFGELRMGNFRDFKVAGNLLYFTARDQTTIDSGNDLWVTDGTEKGTYKLFDVKSGGPRRPEDLTPLNDLMIFRASVDTYIGEELWVSDGTLEGTRVLKEITEGHTTSWAKYFTQFKDKLYFNATDGDHGYEVWVTDGTEDGTHLLKDIDTRARFSSDPKSFFVFKDQLFFSADDGEHRRELWKTDGTAEGTELIKDINSGDKSSNPSNFISLKDYLYFFANDGIHGNEVWRTDGTEAGTSRVSDVQQFGNGRILKLYIIEHTLFFLVKEDDGLKLWTYDERTEKAELLPIPSSNQGQPFKHAVEFVVFQDDLYFTGYQSCTGTQIWRIKNEQTPSLENCHKTTSLKVFPNPAQHFIQVDVAQPSTISILDIKGRRIERMSIQATRLIEVDSYARGMYFVRDEGTGEVIRFLKLD